MVIQSIKNILVINLGGIGDVLLSTPALCALKRSYPHSQIYFLVTRNVFELVKDSPYIDKVFVFTLRFGLVKIINNLKTLLSLRNRKLDLTINMRTLVSKRSASKIKFLLDIINPKVKVGRDTEDRGSFFDIRIAETDMGEKYEMDYDIETVKALGVEIIDRNIDFDIDEGSFKKVKRVLTNEGISGDDTLVGIHLGGKPSHRWPLENFSEAIKEINKKVKCKFIITGENQDLCLVNKLIKKTNIKIISLVGKLNIKELGALIKMCSIYVSGDTSPMHIAAVLKRPLVAIFGPGYINRFDPRNISDRAIVLYKKVDCAPCNRVTCKSMKCLKAITPEEVIEAALGLLKEKQES